MPNLCAAPSAFFLSREAIAVITLCAPFCIAGMTLRTAIEAAPKTPHFTFVIRLSVSLFGVHFVARSAGRCSLAGQSHRGIRARQARELQSAIVDRGKTESQ